MLPHLFSNLNGLSNYRALLVVICFFSLKFFVRLAVIASRYLW